MDSHDFIFVTGLHRSGTSLLHRCLRAHPQISGFHNTGVAEDEGQHVQKVLPPNFGGPGRFGRRPEAHLTEAHPLACPETAQALFRQWSPYWDLSKHYLVEKSPPTVLRTRLFQALFPSSAFVVIVRHPAAVALATFNALATTGSVVDLTIEALIEHWLLVHEKLWSDLPRLNRQTVLRYEEFVSRPQAALDAVYAFLSLSAHPLTEEIDARANARYLAQWRAMSRHHVYGPDIERAMRLEDRVRSFGYSLEDWQTDAPSPLPSAVLETERLLLRRFTFDDVDDLATIGADAETMRFLDGPRPPEQWWGNILRYLREYEQTGLHFWAVIRKADNRLIGRCGLLLQTVEGKPEAEVAYMIARPYWNQGFGTEAARGIKEYALRNYPFERLISLIDPENTASQRVAEKNGMQYERDVEFEGFAMRVYAVDRDQLFPLPVPT